MRHTLTSVLLGLGMFMLLISTSNCAKRGNPEGGPKDSLPPIIVRTVPENYSVNFDAKEIRIYFDEYIRLNNVQRQLVVSPPFQNEPQITPLSAAKFIKIVITDTLKENTTYAINFGKSIVDNNEGNEYEYYKYVFSTGTFIDSLSLRGTINDALLATPEKDVAVMLYEYNENYSDSLIFTEKPYYIANVQDSTFAYELTNLKAGQYVITALKDKNNNYTFDPYEDKIGYKKQVISIPTDSVYELSLFNEVLDYDLKRPQQISKQQLLFGYDGNADSLNITLTNPIPSGFEKRIIKERDKDTLRYWFKPAITADSLQFIAANRNIVDTLVVRWRDYAADSLLVKGIKTGRLNFNEDVVIGANIPIVSVDTTLIKVNNKDSMAMPFEVRIDTVYNEVSLPIAFAEEDAYSLQLLPGAITDYFGNVNDTLNLRAVTQSKSDYGTLTMNVQNAKSYPIIVELTQTNGTVEQSKVLQSQGPVTFEYILPGEYYVRIIYDLNANGIWDTGNFLRKEQPEPVIYFGEIIEANANWFLTQTFILTE
ncbi:MAG: Ig-like domain-containing protein [Gilvibacter sp.]